MVLAGKDWQKELRRMIRRKKKTIIYPSQNVMSRRIEGELGGEKDYRGFRAGIFYFKLSTLIDQDLAGEILRVIYTNCRDVPDFKIATLFLNDPLHRLIHTKSMDKRFSSAYKKLDEFYSYYAEEYEPYSGVMEHLFPAINIYERKSYPKNVDLCVIFTDRFGIEIQPHIQDEIRKMEKNWLYVCVDKDRPLEILEMPEVMEGSQAE